MDHIIPRNQGGPDDLSNFQALCFRCNAGKRDTDRTDFRGLLASYQHRQEGCVFCALEGSGRVLLENELALCIADAYPVSEGHSLVIPRRHVSDGLELHQPEWNAVVERLKRRREQIAADDAGISGWNLGLNSGEAAGQTVFHAHWHLIPRRTGDDKSPAEAFGGLSRASRSTEPWPPRRQRARSWTGQRSWHGSRRSSRQGHRMPKACWLSQSSSTESLSLSLFSR
ncbi:HIT domain-containing protein [Cyanobium sp. ATX-6F1]|uniref:HIT domain-containing protein n=1 Tax=Cyanobium sp. ATX-6F1 TaxID=3137388 RepID=UPI0039BEC6C3